jgi:hypothetical protein
MTANECLADHFIKAAPIAAAYVDAPPALRGTASCYAAPRENRAQSSPKPRRGSPLEPIRYRDFLHAKKLAMLEAIAMKAGR